MGFSSFGFLNFCYRLWRSKKFRKFVIGFGFLAFVLFTIIGNTNIVYGAQEDSQYTTDTTIAILESYQRNVDIFVKSFDKYYGVNTNYTNRFNDLFARLNSTSYDNFLYLRHYSIDNENLNCLFYRRSSYNLSGQVTTNWSVDGPNSSYMLVPTTGYNVSFYGNFNINLNSGVIGSWGEVSVTDFVPSVLMFRLPSEIAECMYKAGYGYSGPIVDIKQQIADMKETQEDIKGDLEKTERTAEEQAEQESQMAEMSNTITSAVTTTESESVITSIDSYFTTLKNTLTYNENLNDRIALPIPFVNKTVYLDSSMLEYYTFDWNFGAFGTFKFFVQSIWTLVFGLMILRLVMRIVNYFVSGQFLNDEGYKTFRSILTTNLEGINPLML